MGAPSVAIQIVNYRTLSFLERCVASVVSDVETSGIDYALNVLENASGDDLSALAEHYPACHVYYSDRNAGFGAGQNMLAAHADALYLLILNPDVEFTAPGTTRALLDRITGEPGITVVGPKQVDAIGRPKHWDHGRLHGPRAQISYRAGRSYWRDTDRTLDVAWISGAAMLIERDAFVAVGGFDEDFFLYKEDEDLCLRVREAGGRVVYEPGIVVLHHGSVVAGRGAELERAERYFIEKHFADRPLQRVFAAIHQFLPHIRL